MRENLRNQRPIEEEGCYSWYFQNIGGGERPTSPPNSDGSVKKSRACHERKQVVVQAVSKPSYVEELSQIVQVLSEHGSFWAATAANSQKQQQKQQFNKHFFLVKS